MQASSPGILVLCQVLIWGLVGHDDLGIPLRHAVRTPIIKPDKALDLNPAWILCHLSVPYAKNPKTSHVFRCFMSIDKTTSH